MNAPTPTADLSARNGLAHVIGDTSQPLWVEPIPVAFKRTVAAHGSREAAVFVEQGVRYTWAELDREVDALAGGLLKLGLEKGDRVGIWSPNRPEWLVAQFATARIGLILVNLNPAYRRAELEYANAPLFGHPTWRFVVLTALGIAVEGGAGRPPARAAFDGDEARFRVSLEW